MFELSPNRCARLTGILLLLTMAAGIFGEMYVPSLMMAADPAATADHLRTHDTLFRLGFAAYLIEAVCDLMLAWLFYVLLKPVNHDLALLSALIALASMALFATTKMFYFAAPQFVGESVNLVAFTLDQRDSFARIFLSLYATLSGLTMLFYGMPWIVRGYLVVRSAIIPKALGWLMIVAGSGFVLKTFTYVLAPNLSAQLLLAPMFLNSLLLALWLLVRGVGHSSSNQSAD